MKSLQQGERERERVARNVVYLWNAWLAVKYVNVTFIYMEIRPGMSLPLECMHGCLVNVTCIYSGNMARNGVYLWNACMVVL